ncbi:MAG: lysophospholipase [Thermoplasmata archaeon]|nr:lysophospholipase [Thermoplasmata archaeon]
MVARAWRTDSPPNTEFVLVHGLKDHSGRYDELAHELLSRGTSVTAFDLRGHGRSGGDRAWVRRFPEFGTDLDAELALVHANSPAARTVLFGHSLGGAIALRYALDHPGRLTGLVLSAPALQAPDGTPVGAAGIVRLLSVLAPRARVFRPNIPGFSRVPAVLEAMAADPLIDPRPVPARTAAELLRTIGTIFRDAGQLTVPVLIVQGTADRVTHPNGAGTLLERVGSTSRRLRSVPGAFHDLWHEPEAPMLRTELANWVAELGT